MCANYAHDKLDMYNNIFFAEATVDIKQKGVSSRSAAACTHQRAAWKRGALILQLLFLDRVVPKSALHTVVQK